MSLHCLKTGDLWTFETDTGSRDVGGIQRRFAEINLFSA